MSVALQSRLVAHMLEAALDASHDLGARVAFAVVDAAGNLAGFVRHEDAFLASSDLAIDKAWTAASFGMGTREFSQMLETTPRAVRDGLLRRPRVTEVPGGMVFQIDGRSAGAVGVSGGSETQDEAIATAALKAAAQVEFEEK